MKQHTAFDNSACERIVLKEEMGSEKSDEDMVLPQATERFILESELAKMLNMGPDDVAQPVTVPEEKCLPTALLISADEMCEEKEERSVDVIKETAKEDINPVVLNRAPNHLGTHNEFLSQSQGIGYDNSSILYPPHSSDNMVKYNAGKISLLGVGQKR
ncbi:uncharacterized protein TNCV_2428321 [Trichonephila clavipes]|nr:uncharacterized protein TNCV_2428321 [Trichonephila clavipes]